jgi:hypothetical protein
LPHHGLFPERLGGLELLKTHPASRYYPLHRENIFRPALGAALSAALSPGKTLFCAHPWGGGPAPTERYAEVIAGHFNVPRDRVTIPHHLVGGLFGGFAQDLRALHADYATLLKALIDTRTRTLEEQVFSCLNAVHPERFAPQMFDTWYYRLPGEPLSQPDCVGRSFYEIFTRLLALPAPISQ